MSFKKINPFWIVIALGALVLFFNLGATRLWDRDEPRNAGCAAEMMDRGDWIVPMFNDELRHQKPVLLYWLIGSAYQVFGVNEFAARFWSSVLALATIALTYVTGRRLFDVTTATVGSLALATSLMFVVAGRAATPDSLLIFCQTSALAIFVLGVFARGNGVRLRCEGTYFPQSTAVCVAMYAMMALGVLAKGLIGVVMPMAIIGLFLMVVTFPNTESPATTVLRRIAKCIAIVPGHFVRTLVSMKPQIAALTVLLVAGPWFALVGWRTEGEFLKLFFLDEHIGRATTTFENHSGGLWYYPLAIAAGFFPWSIFLGPMLLAAVRQLKADDGFSDFGADLQSGASSRPEVCTTKVKTLAYAPMVFLLCWIAVQVGLFSLVSTKLPSYVTPCYPALALCCGSFLAEWLRVQQRPKVLDHAVLASLVLTGLGIAAAFAILSVKYLNGSYWLVAAGLVWVGVAAAGWYLMAQNRRRDWVAAFTGVAVAFCIGLFGFGAVAVDRIQEMDRIIDPIRTTQVPVATYRCLESSWVFYAGQPIWELATDESTASETSGRARYWQKKPRLAPADFARLHPDAMFITTDKAWHELQTQLPGEYDVIEYAPYFLRDKNLLLAAPAKARVAELTPQELK